MLVTATKSAKYHKKYNAKTKMVLATIETSLPILLREFKIDPSKITITVRPLPASDTTGQCTYNRLAGRADIELDCRMATVQQVMNTLAHEMTHAEQYQTGRLTLEVDYFSVRGSPYPTRMFFHTWKREDGSDQCFPPNAGKYTYNVYRNLPWEKEAFTRGPAFAKAYGSVVAQLVADQLKRAA
jgi:hypothetical protein